MSILIGGKTVRRTVLRGLLKGSAVAVGLPFLDCFLDNNGTALASGAALPVRFGSWFWGLGHQPGFGITGKDAQIELLREAMPLERHLDNMNYFDGFNAALDGRPNFVHYGGLITCRTGTSPSTTDDIPAPSFDILVSDAIGGNTRFRALTVGASGGRTTYSARSQGNRNAAEASPIALYARVFGPDFVNPNAAEFKPDPAVMVSQSVLSGVSEQSQQFAKQLGAADRARMDQYFTSIRQLENQLALQLQKPPPNEACSVPKSPVATQIGSEIEEALVSNKAMAQLLAMAMACNQTKVFDMTFSSAASGLRKSGEAYSHHDISHEEPVDPKLGYQVIVGWFNVKAMEGLATFVDAFASVREGDGTLLDNTLIFAHSDTNNARTHQIDGIPVMTFGRAGGRVKTGVRVAGNGDSITRVALTAMQSVGVPITTWGTKSSQVSRPISEILA